MIVAKIDNDGYFIEDIVLDKKCDIPNDCIDVRPPNGLYRAKWTGTEWIEGMSQEEIEELRGKSRELSFKELQLEYNVDLDYRISLMEMGLV